MYAYESQFHLQSNLKAVCTRSLEEEYIFLIVVTYKAMWWILKKNMKFTDVMIFNTVSLVIISKACHHQSKGI